MLELLNAYLHTYIFHLSGITMMNGGVQGISSIVLFVA